MALTLIMPLPIFAVDKPTVAVDFVDTQKVITVGGISYPVYKMVVSAGSNRGILTFNTVFSIDSNVIRPVRGIAGGTFEFLDIDTNKYEQRCLVPKGIYDETYDPGTDTTTYTKYIVSPAKEWKTSGSIKAFAYGLYATVNDADYNPTYFDVQSMYEFYFAIISEQPYKGCIKLETDINDGSLISQLYSNPAERGGAYIKAGGVDYFYKSTDKTSINYTINYPAGMSSKVSSIAVTTQPDKTSYVVGQTFNPAGMVVTATYADDTTGAVPGYDYEPKTALTTANTAITITYTDPFDGKPYTTTQPISVAPKAIQEISAAYDPGTTVVNVIDYALNDLKQYLTVTAHYNDGDSAAVNQEDYSLALAGGLQVGENNVTVTHTTSGKTTTVKITAYAKQIKDTDFTFDLSDKTYNAAVQKPSVTSSLVLNTDYTVAYSNNTNAGTATITVTGIGKYAGQVVKTFKIVQADASVTVNDTEQLYVGGKTKTIAPAYSISGVTPNYSYESSNTDIVTVAGNGVMTAESAGNATVTVTATDPSGNYKTAQAAITVTVSNKKDESSNLTFDNPAVLTYDGNEFALGSKFANATFGGIADGTGTISYRYNGTPYSSLAEIAVQIKNAGTYSIIAIYEDDSQTGAKFASLVVNKAAITITPDEKSKTYGGSNPALTYTVIGKPAGGDAVAGELERATGENAGTYDISQGTVTNANNPNYNITFISGKKFTISAKPLTAADLEYQGDSITKTYDGDTSVTLPANGKIVVKQASLVGEDVSPAITIKTKTYNSSDVTSATKVTFTTEALTGNYSLAADTALENLATITAKDIAGAVITLAETSKAYTGAAQSTTITGVALDTKPLALGADYQIDSTPSITDVGQADYRISGIGNYSGLATTQFTITKATTTISITNGAGSLDKGYTGTPIGSPTVNASISGTVNFKHYSDAAATEELATPPVDAGTYYVKAVLAGTANYNGSESAAFTYTISPVAIGAVTLQTPEGFSVTKVYDGKVDSGVRSGDVLIVPTGVNGETLNVNITDTGNYATKVAETNKTVQLTVGTTLSNGTGKPANYTIGAGFPTSYSFTQASITKAPYSVAVDTERDVKIGSELAAMPAATTEGVNSEKPTGNLEWYSDSNRTVALTDAVLKGKALGQYTFYWKFTVTDSNYNATPKTGSTVVNIVEGDPQNIAINGKPSTITYGDDPFALTAAVTTTGNVPVVGGGTISWTSSDPSVASVDNTGNVTVHKAGSATITASAAAVPGTYAAGTQTTLVTVNKQALTVAAGSYKVTKVYDGTTVPGTGSGVLTVTGVVGGDAGKVTVTPTPPAYASKNVVTDVNLAANLTLSGDQSANYTLASATVSVPCSITKKDITAVSVTGVTKTYDGTTLAGDAAIDGTPTLTGKVAGDSLGIVLTVNSFSDKNVATANKTAELALGALTGADAGNYNLAAASSIAAPATINKANITGFVTAVPSKAILANNAANTGAASLKGHMSLPANVTVSTATAGNVDLPINWADAVEVFNIKGGTYTYKGTVVPGGNFNAYAPTLDAVLTVTPVTITSIATVPGTLTLAKATVEGAANMAGLGFPAQVTLKFDNAVADQAIDATWDTTIESLKTLASTVTPASDKTKTVTLTGTNVPAWATVGGAMPSTLVTITNKFPIPETDITFTDETITYGGAISHAATVNTTTYPSATAVYTYSGKGTTTYAPSAIPPVNAGTYTVVATVENATHKGTKSANLTINPKALGTITISAVADQVYTGSPITPVYTVEGDSVSLVNGTDYTGVFTNNTNSGTATLTITCKGNYTGVQTGTFNITKATPTIAFANTSQKLTSAGNNITPVTATLNPPSAGATVTVHYWVVVTPKAPCSVVHDAGCASLEPGKTIANCNCLKNHTAHVGTCGYVADDIYGWVTVVPQTAGTYKIYGSTAGDANLNAVNASAPTAADVTDTLVISPYSSGGGGSSTPPPVTPPVVTPPATSGGNTNVTATVTPQTTGTTSKANVPAEDMNKAVGDATAKAAETGTKPSVTIKVETPPETKKVEVTLPAKSIETLTEKDKDASVTVESGLGKVTFDGKALAAIEGEAKGSDIVIVAEDKEKHELTKEQQDLVGDRPVIDLYIMSGGKRISDFNGGSATVSIPYELKEGETPEGIVVWYLAEGGNLIKKECTYDPVTKSVTFVAEHFSEYVVSHFPFTDMYDSEWYYENVVYAYTHGLMNGTQPTLFSPESDITRGMVVTILWRMAGEPVAAKHSFKDVQFAWYDKAISWAYANGIVAGYSADRFGPENRITREEMAKILRNYAEYAGRSSAGPADISSFADAGSVSGWARESMQWAVGNGIIGGTNHNTLNPGGSALRAQVAAIMQRFLQSK